MRPSNLGKLRNVTITFSLSLPRDGVSVPVVRHICRNALADLGVASGCISDIELALAEACTNVLKHAEGTGEEYEVTVEVVDQICDIRVIDTGAGFDHAGRAHDDVSATAESGRGIHLMQALVDSVDFISKPETGTVVHLQKTLDLSEASVIRRLAEVAVPT